MENLSVGIFEDLLLDPIPEKRKSIILQITKIESSQIFSQARTNFTYFEY